MATSSNASTPRKANVPSAGNSSGASSESNAAIRVVCRIRGENAQELASGRDTCIVDLDKLSASSKTVTVQQVDSDGRVRHTSFDFSQIGSPRTTQQEMFEMTAMPLVDAFLRGFNASVIAYGQTSSGKTYTMMGKDFDSSAVGSDVEARVLQAKKELLGIIPRTMERVFDCVANASAEHTQFLLRASFVEVYMESCFDLLSPEAKTELKVRQNPHGEISLPDARSEALDSVDDVLRLLAHGNRNRAIACTKANRDSSRGHAIFLVSLVQRDSQTFRTSESQLYLVDLAGSEKVSKTEVRGTQLREASHINRSLLALGKVIKALADNAARPPGASPLHVPFRDSKLTRILKAPLSSAMTCLVITCSPSAFNEPETLSTLRFGDRSQRIKNRVQRNVTRSLDDYRKALEAAEARVAELEAMFDMMTQHANTPATRGRADDNSDSDVDDDAVAPPPAGRTLRRSLSWGADDAPSPAPTQASADEAHQSALAVLRDAAGADFATARHRAAPPAAANDLFHFVCPLSRRLFAEPVVAADGITYERAAIERHFASGSARLSGAQPLSPVTREPLPSRVLLPNLVLKAQIRLRFSRAERSADALDFHWVFQNIVLEEVFRVLVSAPHPRAASALLNCAQKTPASLLALRATCRRLRALIDGDTQLWLAACRRFFPVAQYEWNKAARAGARSLRTWFAKKSARSTRQQDAVTYGVQLRRGPKRK